MGAEDFTHPSLLAAVERRWRNVDLRIFSECKKTREGLLKAPGSENIAFMAWGAAFVISHLRPAMLPEWLTPRECGEWWLRDMRDRRDNGLLLAEERSRIYCGWGFAPVAAVWAFAQGTLKTLCRDWMRCFVSQGALCAVPVKPQRYDPPIKAKLHGEPLFVPECGARSWSADNADDEPGRESAHHMGSSAFESILGAILFDRWHPDQPAHQWELDVMLAARKPNLFDAVERALLRMAINRPELVTPSEIARIAEIASWSTPKWPAFLVRFENGGACISHGHARTVSTAPIYTMGIHDDGTIHYLVLDSGARGGHNIEREPCGMDIHWGARGESILRVEGWAGGDDIPKKRLVFHRQKWGGVFWIVNTENGEIVYPQASEDPVPPTPEPPRPEPEEKRPWYERLWQWLEDLF